MMRELPANESEFFSTGAWVVSVLLLIALFGIVLLFALSPA